MSNPNNISLIDAIEEYGSTYFSSSWPEDWAKTPEPKFRFVNGEPENKEADANKALRQELVEDVFEKFRQLVSEGYLKPFVLTESGMIEFVPTHYFGSIRTLIETGGKTFSISPEKRQQNKTIFFDRSNLNEFIHPFKNTTLKESENNKPVRKKATEEQANQAAIAIWAGHKNKMTYLPRDAFVKIIRERLKPYTIDTKRARKLWSKNSSSPGRPKKLG